MSPSTNRLLCCDRQKDNWMNKNYMGKSVSEMLTSTRHVALFVATCQFQSCLQCNSLREITNIK